jgi:hypothetical protein
VEKNRPLKDKLERAGGLKILCSLDKPPLKEKKSLHPFTTLVGVELMIVGIVLMILWWAYA